MVVGILAWQFVTFLIAIFTKEDESTVLFVGTGIFGIITKLISSIVYKVKHFKRFKGTRSLLIGGSGKIFHCSPSEAEKLTDGDYDFVNYNKYLKDKFSKELWGVEFRNSGEIAPNVRYCPKEVWMKFPSID